jgi:hypothetical protein
MKKIAVLAIALALTTGFINAQEQEPESPAQAQAQAQAQQATPQMPSSSVKLFMGDLTIHGRLMTGFKASMTEQEGLTPMGGSEDLSGNWSWEAINAGWNENRAEIMFDYAFQNFGAFIDLQARNWGAGSYGDIKPRYAFVYANLGPAKFSIGKLYDEILVMQNKVWKTEGFGDIYRFTDEDYFSARLEVKPIEGLNVGAQFFFVDDTAKDAVSGIPYRNLGDSGAWKEIGLGAMYTSSLFNAQLGIRFDSNVDIMARNSSSGGDSRTYLPAYYGDANMLGTPLAEMRGPKYKYKDEVMPKTTYPGVATGDYTPVTTPAPFYDGGHYAFFGFKLNAVKNLTATAHGALFNLGAFDKFGYGRFSENVKYNNILPKLGIGIALEQEFYGGDVFADPHKNSPFLKFTPQITYDFVTIPGMPIPLLQAYVEPTIGVCPDVLENYIKVKPGMILSMGILSAELFYDLTIEKYVESANIKPSTKHIIGCAFNMMF